MDPSSSIPTVTQREQWMVEEMVSQIYQLFSSVPHHAQTIMLELRRDQHIEFLIRGLRQLGPSFRLLDANRPWLCYWILHSIALLGESIDSDLENNSIDFLNRCQDPDGGYGGGPGQLPHLATTYAAVNALMTLGGQKALSSINRDEMRTFLLRMKDPSGGFRMHDGGEMDVRACYTAISVASVLNILDPELVENVGNYILSCQTYEGGIAGEPGSEAHGGYTFCGLATMILINESQRLDLRSLIDWVAFRQGVECGFQGRANKLVDGCYSFWQGAVFALIQRSNSVIVEQLRALDVGGSLSWRSICTGAASNLSEGECGSDVISYQTDERFHAKQKDSPKLLNSLLVLMNFQILVSTLSRYPLNWGLYFTALRCNNIFSYVLRYRMLEGSETNLGSTEIIITHVIVLAVLQSVNTAGARTSIPHL